MTNRSDDSTEDQWVEAGTELGKLLQEHLMEAFQPVLNTVGEDVARTMRTELDRSQAPEKSDHGQETRHSDRSFGHHELQVERRQRPPARQNTEAKSSPPRAAATATHREQARKQPAKPGAPAAHYARVISTTALPGFVVDTRDTIKLWRDQIADMFKSADGFVGAYVLGNPGSSTGLTVTLWESEQAAMASDVLARIVPEIEPFILGEPDLEGYQVIYSV